MRFADRAQLARKRDGTGAARHRWARPKHELRGLARSVVVMLEAGCTDAEVSAITGQSREMVEHDAQAVNQRKLAASAILKWESATHAESGEAA